MVFVLVARPFVSHVSHTTRHAPASTPKSASLRKRHALKCKTTLEQSLQKWNEDAKKAAECLEFREKIVLLHRV